MFDRIQNTFKVREPILKQELMNKLAIHNINTFNQAISNLVQFGLLKRFSNGIYYIPHPEERFKETCPLLIDILNKKYLSNYRGLRVGAYLLYKHRFSTQVSSAYELVTREVSKNTRSKVMYDGKVIVSYPKFEMNESTYEYHEFLEIIHYIRYSDYQFNENLKRLQDILVENNLDIHRLKRYMNHYRGNRLNYMRQYLDKLIANNQ